MLIIKFVADGKSQRKAYHSLRTEFDLFWAVESKKRQSHPRKSSKSDKGTGCDSLNLETSHATAKNAKLLDLADRLQKQNEVLMLPVPQTKRVGWQRLTGK